MSEARPVRRRESPWGMPEGEDRQPKPHRCNDRAEDVIQVNFHILQNLSNGSYCLLIFSTSLHLVFFLLFNVMFSSFFFPSEFDFFLMNGFEKLVSKWWRSLSSLGRMRFISTIAWIDTNHSLQYSVSWWNWIVMCFSGGFWLYLISLRTFGLNFSSRR